MSNASANSSKKELTLVSLNSIAVEFDKEITIIPNKNIKPYLFSTEQGISEINAYSNPAIQKNGKTKRVNKKTGKSYVTRTIPKRLDKNRKERQTVKKELNRE